MPFFPLGLKSIRPRSLTALLIQSGTFGVRYKLKFKIVVLVFFKNFLQFCILDPSVQHLDIEVLDHDLKSDDFLGR